MENQVTNTTVTIYYAVWLLFICPSSLMEPILWLSDCTFCWLSYLSNLLFFLDCWTWVTNHSTRDQQLNLHSTISETYIAKDPREPLPSTHVSQFTDISSNSPLSYVFGHQPHLPSLIIWPSSSERHTNNTNYHTQINTHTHAQTDNQ